MKAMTRRPSRQRERSGSSLDRVLAVATRKFNARTEHRTREPYLFRRTRVDVNDGRTSSPHLERLSDQLDPLEMLTGWRSAGVTNRYHNQHHAVPPFVTLLVGQYGTGKTALVSQLCELLRRRPASSPRPLPISLGSCRALRAELSRRPGADAFMRLLLEGSQGDGVDDATVGEVLAAVRAGRVFLVLDALDELVDSVTDHHLFFVGLDQVLSVPERGSPLKARVIVTMRREYLTSVDGNLRNTLGAFRNGGSPSVALYYALLTSIDDPEIESYLVSRLQSQGKRFFTKLMEHPELRSIIARPILLKVFADLAKTLRGKRDSLLEIKDVVALIKEYVASVNAYGRALQERLGSSYIWDPDLLATKSLELYWTHSPDSPLLTETDLEGIRTTLKESPDVSEPALRSVHKCPFLVITGTGPNEVRFSHKVFFEYFTARGMADEVGRADSIRHAKAFNTLVVNADMRKFLRDMVEDFDGKIEFSCGLGDPEFWSLEEHTFKRQRAMLRSALVILTRGMTHPDDDAPDVEREIKWLLDAECLKFDPGYLRYCFHAVGTYIADRRWAAAWSDTTQRFSDLLQRTGEQSLHLIETGLVKEEALEQRHQLLVERVLHQCLLLRLEWVRSSFTGRVKESFATTKWDADLMTRIHGIIQDIDISRY
jgi:hypothetical protein